MNPPAFHTRRSFLRTTLLGGALAGTLPAFIDRTFAALNATAEGSVLPVSTGRDQPILVILQLSGGNDGLNTLIPFSDDAYHRARPRLAIPAGSVLRLDEHTGLHPALTELARAYGEGEACLLQGVGYPNPNRSHFRAMEIWQTASDADRAERYGWLGRYFDNCCAGADPAVGVNIGDQMPQAFSAAKPTGVSFRNAERFRFAGGSEEMSTMEDDAEGGSIGALTGGTHSDLDPLQYIERVALDAKVASDQVTAIAGRVRSGVDYPASRVGQDLRLIAQLIAGGMPTRVYYASHGGFDTHARQLETHSQLLGQLDAALAAFTRDLKAQGNFDRVVVMTFSEFGRRVAQNGSDGTDHGTAAPMILLGGALRPGLFGAAPSLTKLDGGDLCHTIDFRSVYATVLEKWLKAPSQNVLGRSFPTLGFL